MSQYIADNTKVRAVAESKLVTEFKVKYIYYNF